MSKSKRNPNSIDPTEYPLEKEPMVVDQDEAEHEGEDSDGKNKTQEDKR